jgi:hypothetical protein
MRYPCSVVIARCCVTLLLAASAAAQEQVVDSAFTAKAAAPAYRDGGPTVAIDEAHANFHTAAGGYRPFADLLRSDGYAVTASAEKFSPDLLARIDILVIANALSPDTTDPPPPAFTAEECDAVHGWVEGGGALLLIADHEPFGTFAEPLAARFGVTMGKGFVFDRVDTAGITSQLTFSRDNGRLGEHPILHGRSAAEEIRNVRTFTGQSLGIPDGATALLHFGPGAREAATREELSSEAAATGSSSASPHAYGSRSTSVGDRAQGIAITFGKGRVVVLGEAGFLTAQRIRWPDGREMRFGMNVPGTDDTQFALNVLHWLSRLLQ